MTLNVRKSMFDCRFRYNLRSLIPYQSYGLGGLTGGFGGSTKNDKHFVLRTIRLKVWMKTVIIITTQTNHKYDVGSL